jgi:hypothetical protein
LVYPKHSNDFLFCHIAQGDFLKAFCQRRPERGHDGACQARTAIPKC